MLRKNYTPRNKGLCRRGEMRWQNRRQRAQIKVASFYLAAQVCANGRQISSVCEENNNFISVTVKETSAFGNCALLDLNPAN